MPKMPAHHCHTCLQWQRKVCTVYARTVADHPLLIPESHMPSQGICSRRDVWHVGTPFRTETSDTGREGTKILEKKSRKGAGEPLFNDPAESRDQGYYQEYPQLVGMRMRLEGAASSSLRSRANHSDGDCERWLQIPVASGRPFTHPSE